MKSKVKKKKDKEEKVVETPESSTRKMPNFLASLLNFFLAFAIGAIVIVIFFIFMARVQFTDTFHLEFIIKAVISLILSALVLRVAEKVTPKKGLYAEGIPLALFTLFLCLFIWHFGIRTDPVSVSAWDFGEFKKERVVEVEEEIEESAPVFQEDNPYDHMTPSHVLNLRSGQKSSWIDVSRGSRINIWANGEYDIIYDDGREDCSVIGPSEVDGQVKVRIRSKEDNIVYIYPRKI